MNEAKDDFSVCRVCSTLIRPTAVVCSAVRLYHEFALSSSLQALEVGENLSFQGPEKRTSCLGT